ncbi:zinc finger CCCH domain-containing protein 37 [Carica papaya]|uniref:HUA1 n=1 Tax=Carica papaya TaxID=3649 RepID=A0A2U9NK18_CARPA|nr:zinc finger CCCH domain-containing protein 37 [Carica papaya]AWT24526.1 HUA1 [Carica papaya]AWT24527.1 HUA1 [Carica papaya]AWT24528.1 HUA1 [Carica papaya]
MANQLYGYESATTKSAAAAAAKAKSTLSSLFGTTRSRSETYLSDTTLRYLSAGSDSLVSDLTSKYSSIGTSSTMYHHLAQTASLLASSQQHQATWPPGVDVPPAPGVEPLLPPGVKRSSDVLYHPTLLGAHDTIGQSEAWYTTTSFAKRYRLESTSHLPIYPQRPGEKDCAHYMQTRTCKFGDSCKFDHPIWVPEGGIPDWKEVPLPSGSELPERPGQPDCPYFMKTQRCKFGFKCRFNHPRDKLETVGATENPGALPERPFEPQCAFYMKTGQCKFGPTCKFHHPKDIQILAAGQENGNGEQTGSAFKSEGANAVTFSPALYQNTKGLPIRPGEVDCPFYLKTGSCKYGATCRYNHPDRNAFIPPAAIGAMVASSATNLNIGVVSPATSIYQTIDPRLAQPMLGVAPAIYPQRPGQAECDYYMKTGECKFGERCKFDHPIDRTLSLSKQACQLSIKLTLAGLPRREGAVHCPYYMKTGTCKYGSTCKFDHPPPGEAMAIASSHCGEEANDGGKEIEGVQNQ